MGLFSLTKYKIPNPLTSLIGSPLEQLTHPPPCHSFIAHLLLHRHLFLCLLLFRSHPSASSRSSNHLVIAAHFSFHGPPFLHLPLSIIIVASFPLHDPCLLLLPLSFHHDHPLVIARLSLTTPRPSPSSSSVLSFVPLRDPVSTSCPHRIGTFFTHKNIGI